MGDHAQQDVKFPYTQALELARTLWSVGTAIGTTYEPARSTAAQTALRQWQGVFSQTFATNVNNADREATEIQSSFQAAAKGLAAQWVEAHTEEGRIEHARLVQQARDNRSIATKAWDSVAGDNTDYGQPPPPPATPEPPAFAATAVPPVTLKS